MMFLFRDDDWSSYQVFRCYRCKKHLKNFRNTWIHMRNMHPR